MCSVQHRISMTAALQHHRRHGALITMGCQQRRAVMRGVFARREDMATHQVFARVVSSGRPVVISVWNKKTGAGNQN